MDGGFLLERTSEDFYMMGVDRDDANRHLCARDPPQAVVPKRLDTPIDASVRGYMLL